MGTLFYNWSRSVHVCLDHFRKSTETIKEMGFDPSKGEFTTAVMVMSQLSKSGWERKVDIYKGWGWSDEEILAAFRKDPWCMMASEKKIMAVMDFLVNKMDCETSTLILRSLKKTIIPRGSVVQVLLSKQLIDRMPNLISLFVQPEKLFLKKFVHCFDEAPQLLKLYRDKLNLSSWHGHIVEVESF